MDPTASGARRLLPPLVLASASPRRVELLRRLGVEFRIVPAEVSEGAPEFLTPSEMAQMNAGRKARAVAAQNPDSLVVGADTVVALGDQVFGKPADMADAQRMLSALSGRTHQVVTGVCLLHQSARREKLFAVATDVTFRALTSGQIDYYLSLINPLDKAGAYAIQEHGELIVERTNGSMTNVIGLPLERLREELQSWSDLPADQVNLRVL